MVVQTIVADDELLAREKLRQMLAANADVEVVGEGGSAEEVLGILRERTAQLLFLDICMPGMDAFALLDHLSASSDVSLPRVIFTTAYDCHAIRAFELNAVDYLLKPFTADRLRIAVERAKEEILTASTRSNRPDGNDCGPRRYTSRIVFKSRGRILFLPVSEIRWIGAEENYVRICAGHESHLVRHTFGDMEGNLDPNIFMRVHRSAIVNLQFVKEVRTESEGDFVVILNDGQRVPMSRSYHVRILQRIYAGQHSIR
jgi:two-component system LytT family response regulator